MKFSIITPTHKRANSLARAVASVYNQTYTNWEMIIVNDSPNDSSYDTFEQTINDPRIRYIKNKTNEGVNFSRNRALDSLSIHSDWVIFLDDDDYLAPDALQNFIDLIRNRGDMHWFVTNRAYRNGTPITHFPTPDTRYSYIWSYLILRRGKGDATHCIETKHLEGIRFSQYVRQGDEWFFFYQLGLHNKFYYHDHNSTITDGYDNEKGLNFRKRTRHQQFESIMTLFYEAARLGFAYRPTFLIYFCMRLVRIVVKS